MTYRIYKILNGTIYFQELEVKVNTIIIQHTYIVDILIYEKKKSLNIAALPYTLEL